MEATSDFHEVWCTDFIDRKVVQQAWVSWKPTYWQSYFT